MDKINFKSIIKKHFFTHPSWVANSEKICMIPEVVDAIDGITDHDVEHDGQFSFITRKGFQDPHFIVDRHDGKIWIPFW